jgi:sugar phosphate isomerase/epimerase
MSNTRRGFLAGAAAFGAVPLARMSAADAPQGGTAQFHLGVASYSLRAYQRKLAIDTITGKLHEKYVNIKDFHLAMGTPEEVQRGRREFEKAGLTILGGGTISFPKDDDADIRKRFDYAKNAGMPLIVAAPAREVLPNLEKYVKEYDIKLAVHNHGPEDKQFPTPQSVLEVVKNMDPRVGLCIDVGHTARTGKDVVESVREAGPRLLDMHIKDLKDFASRDSQVDVGDGIMPIPAIFRELIRMNYKGGVMLEYEIHEDDPVPGMLRSFSYMRGVLAGMGAGRA